MLRKREMRAAIEDVRGKCADSDFSAEKRELAMLEDACHECIAFGGDVHANPEKGQLRVQQVQSKQETAFCEPTHGDLARQTLLNSGPITPKPPEPIGGGGS